MKRLIGIAALLLGLPLAAAQAQDDPFMLDDQYAYWGAELGNAQLQDLENVCITCEDDLSVNSYTLKFGFAFTEHLGLEARYLALNNIPGVSNPTFFYWPGCSDSNCRAGYETSYDYNSFGGVVKGRYPLLPNVNVTGSFGRHFWNWNTEYTHINGHSPLNSGRKKDESLPCRPTPGKELGEVCSRHDLAKSYRDDDWTYGAGAEIHFGPNLQGELSYNRMDGGVFHINNYSVGLALQF